MIDVFYIYVIRPKTLSDCLRVFSQLISVCFSLFSCRFTLHSFLPYYYNIRGKGKDGFTYVTYINGGHPPWTLLYPFLKCLYVLAACLFLFIISLLFWLP